MLTVKRPTPTQTLYTVSTRSPAKTIAARAADGALVLLRLVAGAFVAASLLLEYYYSYHRDDHSHPQYEASSPPPLPVGESWLEAAILTSPSGQIASRLIASQVGWIWRMLVCAGMTWLIFRKGYTEESLLVIRGLGVQTSTSSPSYLWSSSTRFIPATAIQDIFIHEAFKGFEVRFYLAIVIEGQPDVVVVFPVSGPRFLRNMTKLMGPLPKSILPRREILEQVWRGARTCLYESKS